MREGSGVVNLRQFLLCVVSVCRMMRRSVCMHACVRVCVVVVVNTVPDFFEEGGTRLIFECISDLGAFVAFWVRHCMLLV